MKTIIISGACSSVGKTTLANALGKLLPGAVIVKIGCGPRKEGKCPNFYPFGTTFAEIAKRHADAAFLIVESNSVAGQVVPDLQVFLNGPEMKTSAYAARNAAHLESGKPVMPGHLAGLAKRLGVDTDVMIRIAWLAGSRPEPAAAVILAGGQSVRMGTDKALLDIEGRPLIARLVEHLRPHFDELIISVAHQGGTLIPGVRHVPDQSPGTGPLMGIHSALAASSCRVNFVIACDVPDIQVGFIRKLLSFSALCDVAIPTFGNGNLEPLLAVYCRDVLPHTAAMIAERNLRVRDLLSRCRSSVVEVPKNDWYRNLNDPIAYRQYVAGRWRMRENS